MKTAVTGEDYAIDAEYMILVRRSDLSQFDPAYVDLVPH